MTTACNDDAVHRPAGEEPPAATPVDRAKVAALRRAIAAGTYRLDPEATAKALLATDALGGDGTG
jgi:flagellar biosynthesis anti-sigma factor FlgM